MLNPSFSRALGLLFLIFPLLITVGCGDAYKTEEVKDYRLHVKSNDLEIQQFFYDLIQDYNERAGIEALSFVGNEEEANSSIQLVQGLRLRDKKVGWGQWIKETKTSGASLFSAGEQGTRTVLYSMKVEFDRDYMVTRMNSQDEKEKDEIFKLFSHEVGHGFLFDHHPDPRNVMYFDVSGKKDYSRYFENVRGFFAQ